MKEFPTACQFRLYQISVILISINFINLIIFRLKSCVKFFFSQLSTKSGNICQNNYIHLPVIQTPFIQLQRFNYNSWHSWDVFVICHFLGLWLSMIIYRTPQCYKFYLLWIINLNILRPARLRIAPIEKSRNSKMIYEG